jgi:hypothetical protein
MDDDAACFGFSGWTGGRLCLWLKEALVEYFWILGSGLVVKSCELLDVGKEIL